MLFRGAHIVHILRSHTVPLMLHFDAGLPAPYCFSINSEVVSGRWKSLNQRELMKTSGIASGQGFWYCSFVLFLRYAFAASHATSFKCSPTFLSFGFKITVSCTQIIYNKQFRNFAYEIPYKRNMFLMLFFLPSWTLSRIKTSYSCCGLVTFQTLGAQQPMMLHII